MTGELPDALCACVGGGSNAIGLFSAFLDDECEIYGVEPTGISTNLGLVIIGMVLPFSIIIGRFAAAMVYVFVNPILYKMEFLVTWPISQHDIEHRY